MGLPLDVNTVAILDFHKVRVCVVTVYAFALPKAEFFFLFFFPAKFSVSLFIFVFIFSMQREHYLMESNSNGVAVTSKQVSDFCDAYIKGTLMRSEDGALASSPNANTGESLTYSLTDYLKQ
jgi:hypothetical protein